MIDDLKPYAAMKDSGVAGPGKVSAHWGVRRLRNLAGILLEHKTKLTCSVVTRKLNVRNASAELPEAEPAPDEDGGDTVQGEAGLHMAEERILQEEDS